ncbi:MAG: hypothetical protein ABIP06_06995 [Pyrinomonadaceae bacterium]
MMRNYFNLKFLPYLCGVLILLVFSSDFAHAQRKRSPVKKASWQYSVPTDISRGNLTLGIRDKWGDMGSFNALFVVTAPSKKVFRARTSTTGDEWAYVNFPDDFDGNPIASGTYTVVFYANGVVIGRSKFRFRP